MYNKIKDWYFKRFIDDTKLLLYLNAGFITQEQYDEIKNGGHL